MAEDQAASAEMDVDQHKHSTSGLEFKLHPLTLLNISDHHVRVKMNPSDTSSSSNNERVVGCLLGVHSGRTVDISNSFELKYSVDATGRLVLDQGFFVKRAEQYKQVFPSLDVVGWYTTGSELTQVEKQFHEQMMELNEGLVFLLFDPQVDPTRKDLPVYLFETELHVIDGRPSFIFAAATYSVDTSEAERIGVDNVAKVLPAGSGGASNEVIAHLSTMHSAIKMLQNRVIFVRSVLQRMADGEIELDHVLLRKASHLLNTLPALNSGALQQDWCTEFNDTLLTLYLAAMTKTTVSMNEVVDKCLLAYEKTSSKTRYGGGGSTWHDGGHRAEHRHHRRGL